mgnify:CR=1 FL=1|jgi:SPP1 family holin|nr:MAG TPA: holin [Caudoviricetes sp.]
MLSLKLIPILWLAVVACNLFVKKFTPELSGWYPAYSGVVAIITLVGILLISCFQSTSSSSGPRRPRKARIEMKKKISAGTLTRTAALGLALTNQLLSAAGKPVLPIDNAQLEQMISTSFTVGAALAAWWKNNSFTAAAIEGDKRMNSLKNQVH